MVGTVVNADQTRVEERVNQVPRLPVVLIEPPLELKVTRTSKSDELNPAPVSSTQFPKTCKDDVVPSGASVVVALIVPFVRNLNVACATCASRPNALSV